ncbi:MAG TPA: zinc ABC transporter substrate-binding protein [Hansschlegelia sp.]
MKTRTLIAGLLATAALTFGAQAASAKTLDVVVSFTVLGDVVKNVGGDHVAVKSLVPPNGDPHEFEPSPTDAKALGAADLAFVSGDGLETWFARLAKAAGYKAKPVMVSTGVKTHEMDEDGKKITDPHVWNSAENVIVWVGNIEKALAAADPDDAADFKANAERYKKELSELNAYAHSKFDAIPRDRRKVLTSHDAFGYFAREYGVTFLSPLGVSTEAEPSAGGVAKLIDQIKREQVKVYFFENSNDPRLIRQIAEATGAKPGGDLYPEALSAADGPTPTYVKMLRYNVDQIAAAITQ